MSRVRAAFSTLVDACETGHGFDLVVPLSFDCGLADSWADKGGSGGQVKSGEYAVLGDALELAAA